MSPARNGTDAELDHLVREAERRAERVVAAVRVVVGLALAVAFSEVVGDRPTDDAFLSRQLVIASGTIGGYLLIGIAAFLVSSRRFHRRWHGFAFVTADAVFLNAGLFLSLDNIGVPANYATAMPTIWILPILLSIGAMRYSPLLQAYAMVVLIGGFLVALLPDLSWNDLSGVAPPVELNPFFARQPNVIRFTMLVIAGSVLVIAVWRTRLLLREALEQSRRRQQLTRFMPAEVARIVETATASDLLRGRRQEVVVLFVDIRGFTEITEPMPPEAVSAFLNRFRADVTAAAAAEGGVVDKFIGDGALVVFGIPEPRAGDAAAAVATGRAILAALERWSAERAADGLPPVTAGIGIHMGEAFVGAVGGEARLEFTVVGDTVNVAARVEEATKTLGAPLIVTEPVFTAARLAAAGWRALPATAIRGHRSPVALYARGDAAVTKQGSAAASF